MNILYDDRHVQTVLSNQPLVWYGDYALSSTRVLGNFQGYCISNFMNILCVDGHIIVTNCYHGDKTTNLIKLQCLFHLSFLQYNK